MMGGKSHSRMAIQAVDSLHHYFVSRNWEVSIRTTLGLGYERVVLSAIRPQILNLPGFNLLAVAAVHLGKALYPHYLVPQEGLKAVGLLVACL